MNNILEITSSLLSKLDEHKLTMYAVEKYSVGRHNIINIKLDDKKISVDNNVCNVYNTDYDHISFPVDGNVIESLSKAISVCLGIPNTLLMDADADLLIDKLSVNPVFHVAKTGVSNMDGVRLWITGDNTSMFLDLCIREDQYVVEFVESYRYNTFDEMFDGIMFIVLNNTIPGKWISGAVNTKFVECMRSSMLMLYEIQNKDSISPPLHVDAKLFFTELSHIINYTSKMNSEVKISHDTYTLTIYQSETNKIRIIYSNLEPTELHVYIYCNGSTKLSAVNTTNPFRDTIEYSRNWIESVISKF